MLQLKVYVWEMGRADRERETSFAKAEVDVTHAAAGGRTFSRGQCSLVHLPIALTPLVKAAYYTLLAVTLLPIIAGEPGPITRADTNVSWASPSEYLGLGEQQSPPGVQLLEPRTLLSSHSLSLLLGLLSRFFHPQALMGTNPLLPPFYFSYFSVERPQRASSPCRVRHSPTCVSL
jgi:hypothetical protein